MCGIFAYTGTKPASPYLLDGLRTLEYRGYDSAGIFVPRSGVHKAVGAVDNLARQVGEVLPGTAGIAHTRWATHGLPTEENAHPHTDEHGRIYLVHNGIIENYKELREELIALGHTFHSKTDTEVLAHLVGLYRENAPDLTHAVTQALKRVRGTYGIAVMDHDDHGTIVVARMGSPIAIGVKDGEYVIASDAAPILRHTKDILYLEDGECAEIAPTGYRVFTLDHAPLEKTPDPIDWDVEDVKKGGYPHYMLKEIMEIPDVLTNTARGRVHEEIGEIKLGGLADHKDKLRELERLVIVGCGSAYYAGLAGKMMIEELAGIPVEVEIASEFRYGKVLHHGNAAVLAVSQSGETADTLACVREAKARGYLTLGVVNTVGSTIARETDAGVYNHAGPEIGVASTKAFISQVEVLALIALYLGRQRGLSKDTVRALGTELRALPDKVRTILAGHEHIRRLAEDFIGYDDFLYIGRKFNYGAAYEGALKLKEVSYAHAEGYGAGEMKHGPIAMIDEWFPTVAIAPRDSVYEKNRSNIEEIRARSGRVLAVATEGDEEIKQLASDVLYIPETQEIFTPILASIPLQLFAYYQGVLRGYNVDRPRNLAKSVTVE